MGSGERGKRVQLWMSQDAGYIVSKGAQPGTWTVSKYGSLGQHLRKQAGGNVGILFSENQAGLPEDSCEPQIWVRS